MIRSLFHKNPDFIGIYDNALSKKECEILINQFEKSPDLVKGETLNGYNPTLKESVDLLCSFNDKSVISNIVEPKLNSYLKLYKTEYSSLDKRCSKWKYYDEFNFQKYDGENDGYKIWHCEHGPEGEASKRILAWMFYLNDAKSGTDFWHFPKVNGKMGRCVIFPSFWTHMHKGITPNIGLKYIITGWVSFTND